MAIDEPNNSSTFEELGVIEPLTRAVRDVGYETPTSIQRKTIPVLLAGRDVIGQAQTGTGKTAAFALPILQNLDPNARAVQALVLTPTRELAIQVAEAVHTYSRPGSDRTRAAGLRRAAYPETAGTHARRRAGRRRHARTDHGPPAARHA